MVFPEFNSQVNLNGMPREGSKKMGKKSAILVLVVMTVLLSCVCLAMVSIANTGTWPDSWPKELEPYRKQAKSVSGNQETAYEISFYNREDFEKAWPHILTLKSPGASLILENSPPTYFGFGESTAKFGFGESTAKARVRILCPVAVWVRTPDGKRLATGPPWPDYLKSESGELPEYVTNENGKWVPADRGDRVDVLQRARVDIVLITDGKIVDLNRIPLPPDTPIIDNRFKDKEQHNKPDADDGE